eukprot:s133_g16.t1
MEEEEEEVVLLLLLLLLVLLLLLLLLVVMMLVMVLVGRKHGVDCFDNAECRCSIPVPMAAPLVQPMRPPSLRVATMPTMPDVAPQIRYMPSVSWSVGRASKFSRQQCCFNAFEVSPCQAGPAKDLCVLRLQREANAVTLAPDGRRAAVGLQVGICLKRLLSFLLMSSKIIVSGRYAVSMGEATKEVLFGRFRRVATSFRVAGVALRDIPTCFKTCRKSFLCGRRNTFAMFSKVDLRFSWQAEHFGHLRRHFSWQAQHFGRVVLRVVCESHCQGCVQECSRANRVASVAFPHM